MIANPTPLEAGLLLGDPNADPVWFSSGGWGVTGQTTIPTL